MLDYIRFLVLSYRIRKQSTRLDYMRERIAVDLELFKETHRYVRRMRNEHASLRAHIRFTPERAPTLTDCRN